MKREFRKEGTKRYVKAKIQNHVIYHPECCPPESSDFWAWTSKTVCGKCFKPIYLEVIVETPDKTDFISSVL